MSMRCILGAIILVASFSSAAVAQNLPEPAIQVELNPQQPLHSRVTLRSGAATYCDVLLRTLAVGKQIQYGLCGRESQRSAGRFGITC
jgi:hypothetical protein